MAMHKGQVDLSLDEVANLVARDFPQWDGLPIAHVPSGGTVNALFRVGEQVVIRLPLVPTPRPEARAALLGEQATIRRLKHHVPVDLPEPLGLGRPGADYDGYWTAYRWLTGDTASVDRRNEHPALAERLADFVRALHGLDVEGRRWDGEGRGGPLATHNGSVARALAASETLVDVDAIAATWERCLDVGGDPDHQAWIHADLMPGNLLMNGGRLTAVIDWGSAGIGDPAVDLMPAWNLFDSEARRIFRTALDVDDALWERGRGWAIVQAIVALPYYVGSNQAMVDNAHHTLAAVLAD